MQQLPPALERCLSTSPPCKIKEKNESSKFLGPCTITQCAGVYLNLEPEREDTLGVLDNLVAAELALAVNTVDERDGDLGDSAAHALGADHHLHLEGVALALGARDDLLQDALLVETERARQVADARAQDSVGKQVGATADKLALEVPAVDAAVASVAGAGDNVVVGLLLDSNHLGDELGVVAKVGVHDDDKVARGELQAVDVGRAETKLASARLEEDVRAVGLDELVGYFLGAVGRAIVDNDEFPVELAVVSRHVSFLSLLLYSGLMPDRAEGRGGTNASVKVRLSSQVMMGRLRRSL